MKKISLIIPVYNVEKYIEKCLLSCLKQDIPKCDYEIIVVNDGTPDNSMAIVERFLKEHNNIQVIHQKNQGLSIARNSGTAIAQGEYIWYIDSDDFIEENCLGRITKQLTNNLDILQLQYRLVYEDGRPPHDMPIFTIHGIVSGLQQTLQGGLPDPAQFSIIRSHFLKKNAIEFVHGILHEDSELKPRVTYLAKKIASDNVISYNYLQRSSGSITSHFKLKNGLDIIKVVNSLINFCDKNNLPPKYRIYFYQKMSINMNTLFEGFHQLNNNDQSKLYLALRQNKHIYSCMIKSKNLKYVLEGLCFQFNIKMALMMHRFFR